MPAYGSRLPDLPNNQNTPASMLVSAVPITEESSNKTGLRL